MSKLFCSIVYLFLPLLIFCQNEKTPNQWRQNLAQFESSKNYKSYAIALDDLSDFYLANEHIDSAIFYLSEGLHFIPDDQKSLKDPLTFKFHHFSYLQDREDLKLIPHLDTAYQYYSKIIDQQQKIDFLFDYGIALKMAIKMDFSFLIFSKIEPLCLNQSKIDYDQLVRLYSLLLTTSSELSKYEEALEYARKGIEVSKKSTDYSSIVNLYLDNGYLFGILKMEGEMESYQRAAQIAEDFGTHDDLARANINLGYYYNTINQPKKALQVLQTSKDILSELKNEDAVLSINREMANSYFINSDTLSAIKTINECIQKCEVKYLAGCKSIYYDMAYFMKTSFPPDTLSFYLKKQLKLSEKLGDQWLLGHTYDFLAMQEERKKNFEQALEYYIKAVEIRDSINTADLEAKLAEERTKQQVEYFQVNQERAELKSQVLSYRNQLFGAVALGLMFILAVGGYLFFQLSKARKQLEQLNETKDRFFGIIAHDIRSPITALDGVGEQMAFYLMKNEKAKLHRLADRIVNTSRRLSSLLDNLLNWALLQKGMIPYHPASVKVKSIIDENMELYQEVAEVKGIKLSNEVSENVKVFADLSAVSTITRNLINNAIKFTEKGGFVSVSTETIKDKVYIKINDTGTGINAEMLNKLFTLNKTRRKGTSNEKGSGLGLLLCKDLVELNKGTISATSKVGTGSSFIFSLPTI